MGRALRLECTKHALGRPTAAVRYEHRCSRKQIEASGNIGISHPFEEDLRCSEDFEYIIIMLHIRTCSDIEQPVLADFVSAPAPSHSLCQFFLGLAPGPRARFNLLVCRQPPINIATNAHIGQDALLG